MAARALDAADDADAEAAVGATTAGVPSFTLGGISAELIECWRVRDCKGERK